MDIIAGILNYLNTGEYKTLILILVFITTVLITVGLALWIMFGDSPTKQNLDVVEDIRFK